MTFFDTMTAPNRSNPEVRRVVRRICRRLFDEFEPPLARLLSSPRLCC
jgi:hypothetical protein